MSINSGPQVVSTTSAQADGNVALDANYAWWVYLAPFLLNMAIVVWLAFSLNPRVANGHDFIQNGWLPARLILEGQNPYQPDQTEVHRLADPWMTPVAADDTEFNSGSDYNAIYPYWMLLLQVPLGLLDFPTALVVWTLLSGAMLLAGLYFAFSAVRRRLRWQCSALVWSATLLGFGLMAQVFVPTIIHFSLGQYSLIIFLLLSLLLTPPPAPTLTPAILFALATMKPQLSAFALLVYLLGWLVAAQWRTLVTAVIAVGALYLAPLLLLPSSLGDWFSVSFLVQKQSTRITPASSSWWGLAYAWTGRWWIVVAALLSLLTLTLLIGPVRQALRQRDPGAVLPLVIIITLLVTPYTIGYDEVLLLLPLAYLWVVCQRSETQLAPLLRLALLVWATLLPLLQVELVDLAQSNYPRIIQTLALLGLYYPIMRLKPMLEAVEIATDER